MPNPIDIIDSHTAGEPTRLVIAGGPDLGNGPLVERLTLLRNHHDALRQTVINEPRGSDVLVGALLCPPHDPSASAGVIFFNNGYLGMCGHGTIGLIASLAYLGRITVGEHRIETPVGTITAHLHPDGSVTVANVASYRHAHHVALTLPDGRTIHGDVAWGGNWFFLCHDHGYDLHHDTIATLTQAANTIRQALVSHGITGADHAEIDHIELFGPAAPGADSRSFVLCPGEAYDRSPCGTGTSAKLACLAADGVLAPDHEWIQESIIGSRFQARYQRDANGQIWPLITGRAYITMVGQIITESDDPFINGIQR